MLNTVTYYASWLFAGLFGYVIPFWVWGLVGLAAAISVFMLLPAAIPERLRQVCAGVIITVGIGLSCGSWGIDHGILLERMKWSRIVAKEQLRLKLEAQENLQNEQRRADEAEASSKSLKAELDAIIASTPDTEPSCPVAIPEPSARSLHNLTGRRRTTRSLGLRGTNHN